METWLGPRFRGPGVAKWPHQKGRGSLVGVCPVSPASFLVSTPTVDETGFNFVASIARLREDFSQPLDMPRFSPDFFISNLF